jgi:flavin reductase (DIM6/NTAB) family NADH-FMN oxidoreductase RutF
VNTLAYDDEIISDIFAGRTGAGPLERFNVGNWQTLKTGAPVLTSAIAVCDCRVSEVKAVGTHDVIFGIVQAISFRAGGPALIYRGRNYLAL